jgi:hypothetical protein
MKALKHQEVSGQCSGRDSLVKEPGVLGLYDSRKRAGSAAIGALPDLSALRDTLQNRKLIGGFGTINRPLVFNGLKACRDRTLAWH